MRICFTAFVPVPVAIPHPPQFANWGTFPPGEGILTVPGSIQPTAKYQFLDSLMNADGLKTNLYILKENKIFEIDFGRQND